MFNYKRYYVWYDNIQNLWAIQQGYDVLHYASSIVQAKRWVTLQLKRG